MTFGEKLKKLRSDNNITQEQLADQIFVTRTAISKWETDKGYPSIDSLKELSRLFNVSIDDLISDNDIENKKKLDEKNSNRMYWIAVGCLGITVVFTLLAFFLQISYLGIISSVGAVLYMVFAFLSKPKEKRFPVRKIILPYVIARIIVFLIVASAIVYTLLTL